MSTTELRRARTPRHLCQRCRDRKALFKYRGMVRADHDHTLCFECYRSELNQARARRIGDAAAKPPRSPFARQESAAGRGLDQRQVAHRQRMLDHLLRPSSVAS